MFKRLLKSKRSEDKEKELLTLQVSEAQEISDIILRRLEEKIKTLKELESSAEEKIKELERLIHIADTITTSSKELNQQQEIAALSKKGLKIDEIARILDMPRGEVELIVSLSK